MFSHPSIGFSLTPFTLGGGPSETATSETHLSPCPREVLVDDVEFERTLAQPHPPCARVNFSRMAVPTDGN